MTNYEELLQIASDEDVMVYEEYDFSDTRLKGLYCNGAIALDGEIKNQAEKACVLAEELGHHYTSTGNIIDLHDMENRKQEYRARLWAYNRQIGLHGLIAAYKAGCGSQFEIAEYLNVTEEFLLEAIKCYRNKYGTGTMMNQYWITFIPNLRVYEYRKI